MGLLERRRFEAERRILSAFLQAEPRVWHYGLDLMRKARMRSGRFYPALRRLEEVGMVDAKWDEPYWLHGQKCRRRMYRPGLFGSEEQR